MLIKTRKGNDDEKFSTPYTLNDMELEQDDIVQILKMLNVEEYSETKLDRNHTEPPFLHIFGKTINGKLIYIKTKIQENKKRRVVCVSFHYAKEKMDFPYA